MSKAQVSSAKNRELGRPAGDIARLAEDALELLGEPNELLGTDDPEEVERVRGELQRLAAGAAMNASDLATGRALAVAEWLAAAKRRSAELLEKFRNRRLGRDAALTQDLAQQLAGLATSAWRREVPGDKRTLALAKNRVTGVLRGDPIPLEAYFPLPSGGCVAPVLLAARSLQNAVDDEMPEVSKRATELLQELLHEVTTSVVARVGDKSLGRDFTKEVCALIDAAHPGAPETHRSSLAAQVTEFLAFEPSVDPSTLRRRVQRASKKTQ